MSEETLLRLIILFGVFCFNYSLICFIELLTIGGHVDEAQLKQTTGATTSSAVL